MFKGRVGIQAVTMLALAISLGVVSACSRTPATPPGLTESGSLQPCPDSPNCVSSLALATDEEHRIDPLPLLGEADTAIERMAALVDQMPRTTILEQGDDYLATEFRTLIMRFGDDVEFLLDEENGLIHVRSASRTGYSDLGVNRRRVEDIRAAWDEANPAE